MDGNEEMLFRPVLNGMLHADRLLDGSVDLAFIALLNEALDVQQENRWRIERHELNNRPPSR